MAILANPSTWRTSPYTYIPYLWIDKPETVLKARVNQASFEFPLTQLTVDGLSIGVIGDAKKGLTMLLGSSDGADDLGRVRIREDGSGSVIYVAESSQGYHDGELNPADNAYITVLNDRRIWTIPPYFDDSVDPPVIYKDYDNPLVVGGRNYGARPGPIAQPDTWRAAIEDGSGSATFVFGDEAGYPVSPSSSIDDYLYDIKDGTLVSGSLTALAMTASFPVGRRYVEKTVTDSNGDSFTSYILIVVLDLDDEDWMPIQAFDVVQCEAVAEGKSMSFIVHEDLDPSTYYDGSAVLFFEAEKYGSTSGSLAGPETAEHMKFVGWLDTESETPRASERGIERGVELRCISDVERMRKVNLLPQLVEEGGEEPADWTQVSTLTPARVMFYLLLWHSTILDLRPFTIDTLGSIYSSWTTVAGPLYDQVDEVARSLGKRFTCDQRGMLRMVPDPNLLDSGDRSPNVTVSIIADDYSEIRLERDRHPREYWLVGEGITSGIDHNPVFCRAPGLAPGQGANRRDYTRQVVLNQSELNARTGHEYARVNSPWRPVVIKTIRTGDAGIEPALMEWIEVTLPSSSNRRKRSFTTQRMLPISVQTSYSNDEKRTKEVTITALVETVGTPAVTEIRPKGEGELPPWSEPWTELPIDWGTPTEGGHLLRRGEKRIAAITQDKQICITYDFNVPSAQNGPSWTAYSSVGQFSGAGAVDALAETFWVDFVVDAFSPHYLGTGTETNGWIAATSGIYRIEDIDGVREITKVHTFGGAISLATIQSGWGVPNWVICAVWRSDGIYITYTTDGVTWSIDTRVGAALAAVLNIQYPGVHVSSLVAGKAYLLAPTGTSDPYPATGYVTLDYGALWSAITPGVNGPDLTTNGASGPIHVPYHDNPNELMAYFQEVDPSLFVNVSNIKRTEKDGTTQTDITPVLEPTVFGDNEWMLSGAHWAIYTCPVDRFAAVASIRNGNTSGAAPALIGSYDGGATWFIIDNYVAGGGTGTTYLGAALSGDGENVIYAWGGLPNNIAYSEQPDQYLDNRAGTSPNNLQSVVLAIAGV